MGRLFIGLSIFLLSTKITKYRYCNNNNAIGNDKNNSNEIQPD